MVRPRLRVARPSKARNFQHFDRLAEVLADAARIGQPCGPRRVIRARGAFLRRARSRRGQPCRSRRIADAAGPRSISRSLAGSAASPGRFLSQLFGRVRRARRTLILNVGSLRDFERFIRLCASYNGQLLNKIEIARGVGADLPPPLFPPSKRHLYAPRPRFRPLSAAELSSVRERYR